MTAATAALASVTVAERIGEVDWGRIEAELGNRGYATMNAFLTKQESIAIASGYGDEAAFRNRVFMARHGYGRGEYSYYGYPLPGSIAALRETLYPPLAVIANRWERALGRDGDYPSDHPTYLRHCRDAGQRRPTPLLLKYGEGDYNCLHRDLYGALAFPLQAAFLLSNPGEDFAGGEFVLTEQRPRMQSRVEVVPLRQGDGIVFAVSQRPVPGARGLYRTTMRHGVSKVRSGNRFALGIIFHDAA